MGETGEAVSESVCFPRWGDANSSARLATVPGPPSSEPTVHTRSPLTSALRIWRPKEGGLLNDHSQGHRTWTGRHFSWHSLIFSHFLADFSSGRTEPAGVGVGGNLTCIFISQMPCFPWAWRKKHPAWEPQVRSMFQFRYFPRKRVSFMSGPKSVWACVCLIMCFIKYLLTENNIWWSYILHEDI